MRARLQFRHLIQVTAVLSTEPPPSFHCGTTGAVREGGFRGGFPDRHENQLLGRGIGIRFKGIERHNGEEYCISEGWVRMAIGKTVDRHGKPLTMKMQGPVEAWFRDTDEKA